jgi:DNA-binding CsgD family transcriptional regulator
LVGRFCYFLGVRATAVFAFFALSALGILSVLWAHRLFRVHRRTYLQPYVMHLAFWNAQALVQITVFILGGVFIGTSAPESLLLLWPLFTLLLGLSLYFLTITAAELRGRTPTSAFRLAYLALWAALAATAAVSLDRSTGNGPNALSGIPALLTMLMKNGTILACMAWLAFPAGKLDDPLERRFRWRFAGLFLAGYALFQLSAVGSIPLYRLPAADYMIAVIQVCFQFAPLWVLSRFLKRQAVTRPPAMPWADLEIRLAPLGLSPREAEIVDLVMRGYSNREIEERLFISLETVKKHVSNIYRKLDVKNRVQLSNLVQNRLRALPEDVPPLG